jgi:hypothetical protein
LTNDTDLDGDTLSVVLETLPTQGTLAWSTNGAFIYQPVSNYFGPDSFTYRATDGGATSALATVFLTVLPTTNTLEGMITDSNTGLPISGALVMVVDFAGLTNFIVTGSDGRYTVTNIEVGIAALEVSKVDYTTAQPTTGIVPGPNTRNVVLAPSCSGLMVASAGPITLSHQTGLFEQWVTISNTCLTPVNAARLKLAGLTTNITVYSAWGTNDGVPFVQINQAIAGHAAKTLYLEYYSKNRSLPTPVFSIQATNLLPVVDLTGSAINIPSQQTTNVADGRVLLWFATKTNKTYVIKYGADAASITNQAMPPFRVAGTNAFWFDGGLPKTESLPSTVPARFYRAFELP